MKLIQYLKENDLTDEEFATRVGGAATSGSVRKWKYGERAPRLPELVRIEEVTSGAVTARDFLPEQEPAPSRPFRPEGCGDESAPEASSVEAAGDERAPVASEEVRAAE